MVEIRICRHTGKELSVQGSDEPTDQPPVKLAEIVAAWAVNTGQIKPRKNGNTINKEEAQGA